MRHSPVGGGMLRGAGYDGKCGDEPAVFMDSEDSLTEPDGNMPCLRDRGAALSPSYQVSRSFSLAVSSLSISVQVIHKLPIGSPFNNRPSIWEKWPKNGRRLKTGTKKGGHCWPPILIPKGKCSKEDSNLHGLAPTRSLVWFSRCLGVSHSVLP